MDPNGKLFLISLREGGGGGGNADLSDKNFDVVSKSGGSPGDAQAS